MSVLAPDRGIGMVSFLMTSKYLSLAKPPNQSTSITLARDLHYACKLQCSNIVAYA